MIKIIETNIDYKNKNEIGDFQSRVIEVDNWDFFTRIFNNYNPEAYPLQFNSCIGDLDGLVMPKYAKINHLEYDDFHLKCDFTLNKLN